MQKRAGIRNRPQKRELSEGRRKALTNERLSAEHSGLLYSENPCKKKSGSMLNDSNAAETPSTKSITIRWFGIIIFLISMTAATEKVTITENEIKIAIIVIKIPDAIK